MNVSMSEKMKPVHTKAAANVNLCHGFVNEGWLLFRKRGESVNIALDLHNRVFMAKFCKQYQYLPPPN